MMAVAALSLAQQDSTARLDALQHYQQALPALQLNLRSADDFYSDGGFLTHFMLLVYEVSFREQVDLSSVHPQIASRTCIFIGTPVVSYILTVSLT